MGVNKAIIIGNLGADPELKTSESGVKLVNLSIATNHRWKDKDGKNQEATEWHRVVAFGRLAEICAEYLSKGRQVYIEGRLQTRKWEDKNNVERWTTEIVAQNMQMLGGSGKKSSSTTEDDLPF